MKSLIYIIFIILIFNLGCKPETTPFNYAEDPVGTWLKGDFHVHSTQASNDTGGDSWPSVIKAMAIARGLDFIVLTDHSNSTGSDPSTTDEDPALFNQGPEFTYWDSASILSDPFFTFIDGNEISPRQTDEFILNPTGHIGCVPTDLSSFDTSVVFTDRPFGSLSGGDALQQALDAGCYSILFHPYAGAPWIKYDWTLYGYDAMEIWNGTGGYEINDVKSKDAWICDLLSGRKVSPVGGSDNHRVNITAPGSGTDPALGYPTTYIFSNSNSWSDILDGLGKGRVSIGEGGSMVYIDAYNDDGQFEDPLAAVNPVRLRARGEVSSDAQNPILRITHYINCVDPRPNHLADFEFDQLILTETALQPGESFDQFVGLPALTGLIHAEIITDTEHFGALSGAVLANY